MHLESISAKNFIGLKLRMFSLVNLSTSTVCARPSLAWGSKLKAIMPCAEERFGHKRLVVLVASGWSQMLLFFHHPTVIIISLIINFYS